MGATLLLFILETQQVLTAVDMPSMTECEQRTEELVPTLGVSYTHHPQYSAYTLEASDGVLVLMCEPK